MKKGVGYIALSDGNLHFLALRENRDEPVVFSRQVASEEEALQAAVDFAMDNGVSFDRAVIAVDGRHCFLRNFRLPVKGPRQLQQVIGFEMDEALPIDTTQVQVDFFKGDSLSGLSCVMAAAYSKEAMVRLIKAANDLGVEVDRVDVDVAAFARACVNRFPDRGRYVGLDIGRERILFCLMVNGKIRSLSVITWGDSVLTNLFVKESGLPREEIDRVMTFGRRPVAAEPGDDDVYSACLKRFLRKVMREISRLLGNEDWPSSFVISGEIVRVQKFKELFERVSESALYVWEEHCLELGEEVDEGMRPSGIAVAYGTAESSGGSFNFCKGKFAPANKNDGWRREIFYVAGLILAVALSFGGYVYANLVSGERQLEYLHDATLEVYRAALPNVSQELDLVQYQSILTSRVQMLTGDVIKKTASDGRSVIETLRVVSSVLDRKTDVEFQNLGLDGKRLDIQGETVSMNEVDRVRVALDTSKIFKSVTVKNAKADKRTKRIRFEIEVLR